MAAPGDLIAGRYRLELVLGRGGMGVVWKGVDERLHRPVALKQLRTHPGLGDAETELANQRAMREARITARLHHPNAVSVFDVVEHEGQPCLVMQLIPSVPLTQVLRELGALEPHEAARVGAQVAAALAEAHRVGIVHRDVKPGNILIGDDGVARISDFGISRALGDSTLTATGMLPGTPAYLAPEVARGADSSAASDVYSLGATLYAAVEGGPPFGTDPNLMALLHKVAIGDYEPPRRAGPLTPLLQRMLSADPRDRPPMSDVAQTLNGVAAQGPPIAEPTAAPTTQSPTLLLRTYPGTAAKASDEPPSATPAPAIAPAPPPPTAAPARSGAPRPRRGLGLAVLALALIAGIVLAAVLLPGPDRTTTEADPPADPSGGQSSSAAEPSPAESSAAEPSAEPSATESRSAPAPSTLKAAPPPAPKTPSPSPDEPSPSPDEGDGTPTAAELAQAITDYYALMPDDTDNAWPRMTRSYQVNTARGRDSYEAFWDEVERVSVSDVTGSPPSRAEATVTYVYKDDDRATVRERTAYELVDDDGELKINDSDVLSSG